MDIITHYLSGNIHQNRGKQGLPVSHSECSHFLPGQTVVWDLTSGGHYGTVNAGRSRVLGSEEFRIAVRALGKKTSLPPRASLGPPDLVSPPACVVYKIEN